MYYGNVNFREDKESTETLSIKQRQRQEKRSREKKNETIEVREQTEKRRV